MVASALDRDDLDVAVEPADVHGSGVGIWLMYWTLTALGGTIERPENSPRGTVVTFQIPIGGHEHVEGWNPDASDGT